MDINGLINMVGRMIFGRLLRRGIDAGIDRVAGSGKAPADMTPEERQQSRAMRRQARQARQAIKAGRRIGRM
jgi:hypothetical protein